MSGDGPNNIGSPVVDARDVALSAGIVINGLPMLIRPSPTYKQLDRYYADCVIGGPGSFVLPVYDMPEFADAIRRKLILEVSGDMPEATIVPVAGDRAGRLPQGRARPPAVLRSVFSRAGQVARHRQAEHRLLADAIRLTPHDRRSLPIFSRS